MKSRNRIKSIDWLRGFAIIAMIQSHIWNSYISQQNLNYEFYKLPVTALGGYAAPLFTMISGASSYLASRKTSQLQNYTISKWNLFYKRGAAIFFLSTIINIISGQIYKEVNISILNWSIFQVIGVCLFLVPIYFHLNWIGKIIWISLPLILSEWIYPNYQMLDFLFNGFAPIFPWSSLFFSGMLICELLFFVNELILQRLLRFTFFGALLMIFGISLSIIYQPYIKHHVTRFNFTSYIIYLGVFILLLVLTYYIFDYRFHRSTISGFFIGFGQYSLTIYYLQLFGIVLSPILIKALTGYAPQLTTIWFIPLIMIALFILHTTMNIIWAKFNHMYTLEWFLSNYTK